MRYNSNNTKSNGRRLAQELLRDGMDIPALRNFAALTLSMPTAYHNRHAVVGLAEEVARLTCWHGWCACTRHDGDFHSSVTGHGWTEARY